MVQRGQSSQTLSEAEQKHSQIKMEGLACVFLG